MVKKLSKIEKELNLEFKDNYLCSHWSEYSRDLLEGVGNGIEFALLTPDSKERLYRLDSLDVFKIFIPELNELKFVPQNKQNSSNAFHHTILVVENSPSNRIVKWAALLHDIGKINYKKMADGTYDFRGHEYSGSKIAKGILKRMKIKGAGDISRLIQFHSHPLDYQRQPNWKMETVIRFVDKYNHLAPSLIDLAIADKIASSSKSSYLEELYNLKRMVEEIQYNGHKQ